MVTQYDKFIMLALLSLSCKLIPFKSPKPTLINPFQIFIYLLSSILPTKVILEAKINAWVIPKFLNSCAFLSC